ncbi:MULTISPECIES: SgcJ/EcaC family oxidoreductase [unclassified Variovorax]|jgi:uncharacterized protein (TIGR02246 family)|uniref:YybH family protein n=1 Tax=unclassified Variovorax TaxID=663243 RepID=UPI000F7ED1E3|nr:MULTISPECIES: SgcJ/EcaC family oxidoreductase [unclassified Variovorax]RSZ38433.1 SgcJ/EcaC family oxidoreductase [Variovorax sp. 553]RSZ39115.1 SgcJ/EcaC family oxidoreductase [Variovorax sp. 679]
MNRFFRKMLVAAAAAMVLPGVAFAADGDDAQAVRRQLLQYEQALNASSTDKVMALYAADAVFMPQNSMPAVGRQAVRESYDRVFGAIRLNVRFEIDEVGVLSPGWAYARTRSNGTVQVLGSAAPPGPESNQELFLLHREPDGQWRFARYIFSATTPPAQR